MKKEGKLFTEECQLINLEQKKNHVAVVMDTADKSSCQWRFEEQSMSVTSEYLPQILI